MMRKKILLISDNPSSGEIKNILEDEVTEVYTVSSLGNGFDLFLKNQFFLVILDVAFSKKESIDLLVKICREKPVPIFVLSGIKDPAHRAESLKLITNKGISDRPKICMRYEQAQSLICSYMKKNPQCKRCYTFIFGGDLVIDPTGRQVSLNGAQLNLTRKEFDLLFCLASHAGQVLSREQLYQMVWDENSAYNVDETVKAHIKSLRKKLTPEGAEYIKNVWGIGYRFSADENKEQS